MRTFRTYHEAPENAGAEVLDQVIAQGDRLRERLSRVRHVVAVASGKGGVGKSALTANLAAALASRGLTVGAADGDLNGPSLARMLDARGPLTVTADGIQPAAGVANVRVMSMDLLVDDDAPVRWREAGTHDFVVQSTLEAGALREFIADVEWGDLDILLIDMPPGTDKLHRLMQIIPAVSLVLLVTTPSDAARFVVRKSVSLAQSAGCRLALLANMCTYTCVSCGAEQPLFGADAARSLAEDAGVELWAELPFDPELATSTDAGEPIALKNGASARTFAALAERVDRFLEEHT